MEAIQAIFGFIFGVVIFLMILSKLRIWFMSYAVMIFFFFISLCLGMILAKVLSWLIIIITVICAAILIYVKFFSGPSSGSNSSSENK